MTSTVTPQDRSASGSASERLLSWLQLAGLGLLTLSWLVPNHYPPWTSFYNELVATAGFALFALSKVGDLAKSRLPNTVWVLAAVALIPVLQFWFGLLAFSGDVWVSMTYVLGLAAAIAVGSVWARKNAIRAAEALCTTVLLGALVSCALAVAQLVRNEPWDIWLVHIAPSDRTGANLGQPNNLAMLLALGCMSVLLLRESGRINRAVAAALVVTLLAGGALTQSRTALLFGPAVLALYIFAKWRGVGFLTPMRTVAFWVLIQWLLYFAWPHVQTVLLEAPQIGLAERGTQSIRTQMWPMLIDALNQAPWSGYGWLQVGAAELAVVNKYPPVEELWLHGHNLFLELLVWAGYPVGTLLIALVVYWYVNRARRVASIESAIALMMVSMFGIHAMLELPHHYLYFLLPIGLAIGQLEAGVQAPGVLPRQLSIVPPLAALVLAALLCKDYFTVESDFRLARFENLRIGSVHADRAAPDAPFLSTITAFLRFTRAPPAGGLSDAEIADMRTIVRRYPYPPSLARFAQVLALNGRPDEARDTVLMIRQIFGLGTYLRLRGELKEAVADGAVGLGPLVDSLPDKP